MAPEIVRLCQALAVTTADWSRQSPPVLRLCNLRSEFVLRAYRPGATDGDTLTRDIGITIKRRLPGALALRRRVDGLELTAREKQLWLLLVSDRSRRQIKIVMGIAGNTATAHQRGPYAELDMHSRGGLLAALQQASIGRSHETLLRRNNTVSSFVCDRLAPMEKCNSEIRPGCRRAFRYVCNDVK